MKSLTYSWLVAILFTVRQWRKAAPPNFLRTLRPFKTFKPFNRCAHQLLRPVQIVQSLRSVQVVNRISKPSEGDFHVLTILKTSKHLTVVAAAKKSSDLVVVAEERNEKFRSSVLKDESEIAVAAAFEKLDS
jgi:hypothetical protein